MSTQVFETKLIHESIDVSIDMLSRLQGSEVFSTVASAISVEIGDDPLPAIMLSGDPTLSGTIVTQKVTGGISGVIYKLALSARTDANNIYINEVKLAVLPDDAAIPE